MNHECPFFSIVIPTYDRPERLRLCLLTTARLDYPPDRFEVIVVDDGGKLPLGEVGAEVTGCLSIQLLTQGHGGPAKARNTGAAKASGEYLAFLDDDCVPATDWLRAFAGRFARTPDHLIGGRILNALPDNVYAAASQAIVDVTYSLQNKEVMARRRTPFFAANNLAVPANAFREIGGFDPRFPLPAGEDREFCNRWTARGGGMIQAPEALVYHFNALTLSSFWKQQFAYGRGAHRFHRTKGKRGAGPFRPDWELYRNILCHAFSCPTARKRLRLFGLLVLSQVANGTGFLAEALDSRRPDD